MLDAEMGGALKAAQTTGNLNYPTERDLDLMIWCFNHITQASCSEMFRQVHVYFDGRINMDPVLAAAATNTDSTPSTSWVTRTSTSTASVRK